MSPGHYAMLAGRLTVRDRWIARMVAEHRTLTSTQIAEIAFPSRRAANLRLLQLYQWRIMDRFQPHVAVGSAPMFYVLDVAGAHALAHKTASTPRPCTSTPNAPWASGTRSAWPTCTASTPYSPA